MKTDLGQSDRAVAINPEAVIAGQWIAVTERLPEPDDAVLVWCDERGSLEVAGYRPWDRNDDCWAIDGTFYPRTTATHWMPLPTPPAASGSPLTSEPDEQKPVVGAQVGAAPPLTDEQIEELQDALPKMGEPAAQWGMLSCDTIRAVIAAMQHPSGGDQRTEGSGSSDRAQASAVRRPADGEPSC